MNAQVIRTRSTRGYALVGEIGPEADRHYALFGYADYPRSPANVRRARRLVNGTWLPIEHRGSTGGRVICPVSMLDGQS